MCVCVCRGFDNVLLCRVRPSMPPKCFRIASNSGIVCVYACVCMCVYLCVCVCV